MCLGGKCAAPGLGQVGVLPLSLSFPDSVTRGFGGAGLEGLPCLGVSSTRAGVQAPTRRLATSAAAGSAPPPARVQLGPNPAGRDPATPDLTPPSLPVPLAGGTQRGDGYQVRRRRRRQDCRPGPVHGRASVFGCPCRPSPPPPTSRPLVPCAAATSANLPCVIASSGRRWEGTWRRRGPGREGEPRTWGSPTTGLRGRAGAEIPPQPRSRVLFQPRPLTPPLRPRPFIPST